MAIIRSRHESKGVRYLKVIRRHKNMRVAEAAEMT